MNAALFAGQQLRCGAAAMAGQINAALCSGIIDEAQAVELISVLNTNYHNVNYRFALIGDTVCEVAA